MLTCLIHTLVYHLFLEQNVEVVGRGNECVLAASQVIVNLIIIKRARKVQRFLYGTENKLMNTTNVCVFMRLSVYQSLCLAAYVRLNMSLLFYIKLDY